MIPDNIKITFTNDLNNNFDGIDKSRHISSDQGSKDRSIPYKPLNGNRKNSLNSFPIFERPLTGKEVKIIYEKFPVLLRLIKEKDSVQKYKQISKELYSRHNELKNVLKIEGFYRLYCYYRKFYVCFKFDEKSEPTKIKKSENKYNNDSVKICNSKIVNIVDNKNFVKISNSIKRFILSLSNDFSSTIFITNAESKKNEINKILNKLEEKKLLPDFLIKSKLHFDNGDFYSLDLLSEDTSNNSNSANTDNDSEILTDAKRQKLLDCFPTLSEVFFMQADETLETCINIELENLRNIHKNNAMLKCIEFKNQNFINNSIKSTTKNNPPIVDGNDNITDIMFDFGAFDLLTLAETDSELKALLTLPKGSSKIVDTIFHINYLALRKKLKSNIKTSKIDKAINYLRNCGILYSVFSLEEALKLEQDKFETWGKSMINNLPKMSFFRSECENCILELVKNKLLFEFEIVNKNLISKDIILKLNLFLSNFEKHFADVSSQVEIIDEIKLLLNEKILATKNEIDRTDNLKFVLKIINKKLTALKTNNINFSINQYSRIISPTNCENISEILDDILTFVKNKTNFNDGNSPVEVEKTTSPEIADEDQNSISIKTRLMSKTFSKSETKTGKKSKDIPSNKAD